MSGSTPGPSRFIETCQGKGGLFFLFNQVVTSSDSTVHWTPISFHWEANTCAVMSITGIVEAVMMVISKPSG